MFAHDAGQIFRSRSPIQHKPFGMRELLCDEDAHAIIAAVHVAYTDKDIHYLRYGFTPIPILPSRD
jgi:hypothetical protein